MSKFSISRFLKGHTLRNSMIGLGLGGAVLGRYLYRGKAAKSGDQMKGRLASDSSRKEGAISAVTGGHPEEMNAMPTSANPDHPIYDGSDISRRSHYGKRHKKSA